MARASTGGTSERGTRGTFPADDRRHGAPTGTPLGREVGR
jgi:hypothetical protein